MQPPLLQAQQMWYERERQKYAHQRGAMDPSSIVSQAGLDWEAYSHAYSLVRHLHTACCVSLLIAAASSTIQPFRYQSWLPQYEWGAVVPL